MQKKKNKHISWQSSRPMNNKLILSIFVWIAVIALLAWLGSLLTRNAQTASMQPAAKGLVISEVMSGNSSTYPTESGQFYDWVELWNSTDHALPLKELKISNSFDSRTALTLPDQMLEAGGRIVVYCAGKLNEARMEAGFTLDKDGDNVYLYLTDNQVLDSLTVPALRKGEVYALDEQSGEWVYSSEYTPGLENTHASHERLIQAAASGSPVYISEVMASNKTTITDADGDYSDWVEIYNSSDVPVNLSGWGLTTDVTDRMAFRFPNMTLGAREYCLVFASGKTRSGDELHAPFKLSSEGETVYLVNREGKFASIMQYGAVTGDQSVSRLSDGSISTAIKASPGHANTLAGAERALGNGWRTLTQNPEGLYINEVLCYSAGSGDWVELYNGSSNAIDLSGWWLSDNLDHPRKWEFPAGASIAPNEYKVIALSGASSASGVSTPLQTDFSLSAAGDEVILLSRPDGSRVDLLYLYNQKSRVSYGRLDGYDQYRYFESVTPGSANSGASYSCWASRVEFSRKGGKVTGGGFMLELESAEDLPIYYTLDGSTPSMSSSVYTGPIQIDSNTVVKAIAWSNDCLPSETAAATYVFDTNTSLRLVCVSGDPAKLSGAGGVLNTGEKTAQSVCVEVYDYDGSQMLSQSCELTTSGRGSRVDFAQKAFRLVAKSSYGRGRFNAKLFTRRDCTQYNSFTLRASGQDCERAHMVDSVLTSLAADTSVLYQETELAAVYVNGQYWGMYNMRERIDSTMIAAFEGWEGQEDDIDILEGMMAVRVQGSSDSYKDMIRFAYANDLTVEANLEALRKVCDIENYLYYVALQIYTANEDLNNVRVYRNANADGKWRWAFYDLDLSYRNDKNSIGMWLKGGQIGSITQQDSELFRKLMLNSEMRDYFLTRFGELLATTLSSENVFGLISDRYEAIKDEMVLNCQRWGWSYDSWVKYVKTIANYAIKRPGRLIEFAQSSFELSDAEVQKYFGAALEKNNAFSPNT